MFHMFRSNVSIEMMIYECLMLMLMLCESSYARLTPEVLQAFYSSLLHFPLSAMHEAIGVLNNFFKTAQLR